MRIIILVLLFLYLHIAGFIIGRNSVHMYVESWKNVNASTIHFGDLENKSVLPCNYKEDKNGNYVSGAYAENSIISASTTAIYYCK